MSTPVHKRHPARLDSLKFAKQLELHTIKKVLNKSFSKKKYRVPVGREIIRLSINCFTLLEKSEKYEDLGDYDKSLELKKEALSNLLSMSAQLDVANTIYDTPIDGIEYWSGLIVDLKESIDRWILIMKKP